jgi:hypothetical protein
MSTTSNCRDGQHIIQYGLQRDRAGPKVAENQDLSCETTCGDTRLRELEWLSTDHWQKLAQSIIEEHVIC